MPGGRPLPAQLSPPSDQVDEVLQRPRRAPFLPAGPTRKGRVRWWPGGKGAEVGGVCSWFHTPSVITHSSDFPSRN